MITIKKILILLTLLFFGGIIFFTSVGLKSVNYHVKIYSNDLLTTKSENGIRLVCLKSNSRYAFTPCEIDLKLINRHQKSYQLLKKRQPNGFFNATLPLPKGMKPGQYTLVGIFKKGDQLIGKLSQPVQVDGHLATPDWFPFLKPKGVSKNRQLFRTPSTDLSKKDYFQSFSRRGTIAPFTNNTIYLLATRPNYFPRSFRGELDIRGLHSRGEQQPVLFDRSGLAELNTHVDRVSGDIIFTDYRGTNHLIPFEGKFPKMEIELPKYRFNTGEIINFTLKKHKKRLTTIQLSIFSGDHWIDNRMVRFTEKSDLKLNYTPPEGFNGFLDIVIHRDYDLGNYLHKRRIFVGSRTLLDLFLSEIDHPYIEQIIYHGRQTDRFYEMILSQLAPPFQKPPLVYDSFDDQHQLLLSYQKKMQGISWWFLFILSWIIVALLFFWSYREYDRAKYQIDYDFQKKGSSVIFIVPITIAAFLMMLMFILNIA